MRRIQPRTHPERPLSARGHPTHVEHGFGPVWDAESRVLVLGSMPSPKSRAAGFYYMHPRNRFWPVMGAVFAEPTPFSAAQRRQFALSHHVALWDVIAACDIVGASDASIRNAVPNDLHRIIRGAPIRHVFTTGTTSARLYLKLCGPRLAAAGIDIPMTRLPSTSPANAVMTLPKLVDRYRIIATLCGATAQ